MPQYAISELTDPEQIRSYLLTDAVYAAYALADLEPPFAARSRWYAASRTGEIEGLALVYNDLEPPLLFLMGENPALSALLAFGIGPDEVAFAAPGDMAAILPDFYHVDESIGMFRMRVTRGIFNPYIDASATPVTVEPLNPADAPAAATLIRIASDADGREAWDVPFSTEMLGDGYYRGIRVGEALVAIAGTHIVSRRASVAAVGNVVVHPEHRRMGFGGLVSQVVTEALLNDDFELVVLNVRQNNQAANKIYRRLGYRQMAAYVEGHARRY